MRLAGRLANIIDNENPDLVIIDTTNEHGVLDRLHELGYKTVKGVHFGMGAIESDMYRNIRAEMYFKGKAFFDEDVQIPDDDEFISELAAMPDYKETSSNLKYLEGKDKIREELKRSPNKADSWAATFAYPVRKKYVQDAREGLRRKSVAKHSTTLNTLKGVRRGI
jgi:hypothetical protein